MPTPAPIPGKFGTALIDAESRDFLEGHAEAVTRRLTALQPELQQRLRVRAGAELQSTGDMRLSVDWNLPLLVAADLSLIHI